MRIAIVTSLAFLLVACSRELPTEPVSAKSAVVSEATGRAARRHVAAPPAAACANVAGTWDVRYEGSCPADMYPGVWELEQSSCTFHTPLYPDMPAASGSLDSSGVTVKIRNGFTACEYDLEGRGTLANGVITATLTGPVSGPCCGTKTETVRVVATRR